jgi:redox-sensitive bicupin YhaK (pirin superfamily)
MPTRATLAGDDRTVLFDRPKTVRLALGAGERVPPHSHPGETVVCHVAEGRLRLELDGDPYDLAADDLLRFEGARDIAVEALADARAVLFFAPAD